MCAFVGDDGVPGEVSARSATPKSRPSSAMRDRGRKASLESTDRKRGSNWQPPRTASPSPMAQEPRRNPDMTQIGPPIPSAGMPGNARHVNMDDPLLRGPTHPRHVGALGGPASPHPPSGAPQQIPPPPPEPPQDISTPPPSPVRKEKKEKEKKSKEKKEKKQKKKKNQKEDDWDSDNLLD